LPPGPSCSYGLGQPYEPQPACGPSKCGNATIDSCAIPMGGSCEMGDTCTLGEVFEDCDGATPAEQSCEGLGYSGGELGCTGCDLDTTHCSICSADPRVVQCGELVTAGSVRETWQARLSPRADEVGLLWRENSDLRFARLSSTLEVLSTTDCFAGVTSNSTVAQAIALAATQVGWLVAAVHASVPDVQIVAIDATGNVLGSRTLPNTSDRPRAILEPSPEGGALLVTNQEIAMLDAEGNELSLVTPFPDDELEDLAAARTANGFLVAGQYKTAAGRYIQTWQVDATGLVTAAATPLAMGMSGPYTVKLASYSEGVFALWSANPDPVGALLDSTGAELKRVVLDPALGFPSPAPWGEGVALYYANPLGDSVLRYLHTDGTLTDSAIPIVVGKGSAGSGEMAELASGELLVTLARSKSATADSRLLARVAPSF